MVSSRIAAGAVGELMAPQSIAGIVVLPAVVGLPEVDERPRDGRARRVRTTPSTTRRAPDIPAPAATREAVSSP